MKTFGSGAFRAIGVLAAFAVGLGAVALLTPGGASAGTPVRTFQFVGGPFSEPVTDPPQVITIQAIVPNEINGFTLTVDYDETVIDVTAVANVVTLPGTELCAAETPDRDLGGGNLAFENTCAGTSGTGGPTGTFNLTNVTFDCLGSGTSPLTFIVGMGGVSNPAVAENFQDVEVDNPVNSSITCTGGTAPPTATPSPTATATATPCNGACPTATATSQGAVRTATPTLTPTPIGGVPPTEVPGGETPAPPPSGGTVTPGGTPGSGAIQPPDTGSGGGTSTTMVGITLVAALALAGAAATGTGYMMKKRRMRI